MFVTFDDLKKIQRIRLNLVTIENAEGFLKKGQEYLEKQRLRPMLKGANLDVVWAEQIKKAAEEIIEDLNALSASASDIDDDGLIH